MCIAIKFAISIVQVKPTNLRGACWGVKLSPSGSANQKKQSYLQTRASRDRASVTVYNKTCV